MKILITGSNGQLGSELTKILREGRSEIGPIPEVMINAQLDSIDLDDLDLARFIPGQILEHGRRHAAWRTPFGPEIHKHRSRGFQLPAKADVGSVNHPRERAPAFSAYRDLIRGRRLQPVPGAALRADRDGVFHEPSP